jgi:hypothetical protein
MRTTVAANLAFAAFAAPHLSAQSDRPTYPDLSGTYDIASMTPLERAPGTPLVNRRGSVHVCHRVVR